MTESNRQPVALLLRRAALAGAGAAGAGVGLAQTADAAIIHTDLSSSPITLYKADDGNVLTSLDVDGNSSTVTFSYQRTGSDVSLVAGGDGKDSFLYKNPTSAVIQRFEQGDLIGGNYTSSTKSLADTSGFGMFQGTTDGYIGVFLAGNRRGWIEVSVDAIGSTTPLQLTITGYAYEDRSGVNLRAGQTVPTPGTLPVAIGLLAMGALRRTRKPVA